MIDDKLNAIRDLIQHDPGGRGLATDPVANLLTACADDFAAACRSIAGHAQAAIAIVTGFLIPTASPPAPETDGPLGAVFLARALTPLGIRIAILTDTLCRPAIEIGIRSSGLAQQVQVLTLPAPDRPWPTFLEKGWKPFVSENLHLTHLIALERVGPSHTPASIQSQNGVGETLLQFLHEVPAGNYDRCHTMRGLDISVQTSPAHLLFESMQNKPGITTIGIGDGGNEIGMGKIPWDIIRRNIPGGAKVACRIPTDHLIVAGVSNWGAYGLAAGVWLASGRKPPPELFDVHREREILCKMVEEGKLVDGLTAQPTISVDGLAIDRYAEPLRQLAMMVR